MWHPLSGPSAERKRFFIFLSPAWGSEDFGHYLEKIPGMLLRAGTRSGPESAYPLHSDHFDIDEGAMAPTAALMAHVLHTHPEQESG